jgi:tRNA pseudouridine55 synthase
MPIQTKPFDFWGGETLLIDKPLKWTSFDVVNKLRIAISHSKQPRKKIKVGHAGTLDPLATGLLIICTGKNTKTINELQALTKEYTGTITLGATRPSYDMETEIDQTFDIGNITEDAVHQATESFKGVIEQFPPIFSAIKVDGKRLYLAARKGQEVELKSRTVEIHEFEITKVVLPDVHFRIHCSKGTYIRSIAYDFGKALNNGAYLSALRRTRIGEHKIADAWELETLIAKIKEVTSGNGESEK